MKMPALPNSELAVMELLWRRGRLPARQIQEALYPDDSRPQHGTVQRLLKRLEEKGYVVRDRDLGVNLFSPTLSKETYAGNHRGLAGADHHASRRGRQAVQRRNRETPRFPG